MHAIPSTEQIEQFRSDSVKYVRQFNTYEQCNDYGLDCGNDVMEEWQRKGFDTSIPEFQDVYNNVLKETFDDYEPE